MKKLAVLFVGLVCFLLTASPNSTTASQDTRAKTQQQPFAKEVKAKPPPGNHVPHGVIVEPCGFDRHGRPRK